MCMIWRVWWCGRKAYGKIRDSKIAVNFGQMFDKYSLKTIKHTRALIFGMISFFYRVSSLYVAFIEDFSFSFEVLLEMTSVGDLLFILDLLRFSISCFYSSIEVPLERRPYFFVYRRKIYFLAASLLKSSTIYK